MLQLTVDASLVPAAVVVAFNRSFLAPWFHDKFWLPERFKAMLACPLCLGFHVSWLWLLLLEALDYTNTCVLDGLVFCLLSSVLCYVIEHIVQAITVFVENKSLQSSEIAERLAHLKETGNDDHTNAS